MKYLMAPLLIVGMFFSFGAALVAMLFFTKTVKTPEELVSFVLGNQDSTDIFEEFRLKEDRLAELAVLTEEYKTRYEEMNQQAAAREESLATMSAQLQMDREELLDREQKLGVQSDSSAQQEREASLRQLATFYDKIKAQRAAEILQQETELSDTTVATLMKMLQPQQMAKIMGSMDPDFAARITKIIRELPR